MTRTAKTFERGEVAKQRCSCGSNYKPGERVSIFDFCLLCWGTGWRLPTTSRRIRKRSK